MQRKLVRNSGFNILYNLANVLFPLMTSMYVSRILLASGVGKVAFGQTFASYFVFFSSLGLPAYGVREIARIVDDQNSCNKLFTELFLLNALFTIVSTAVYYTLIIVVPVFHKEFILFSFCGIQVVLNIFNIDWFYQGREDYVYISVRSIIVKAISFLVTIIVVKNVGDYAWYALIISLAVTVNYLCNIFHSRKYVQLSFNEIKIKPHLPHLFVLAASVFLMAAYSKIDITMLGMVSSESATGIYSNAHKLVDIVVVMCASISSVFLPRLSNLYLKDKKEFNRLIEIGLKVLSFITFPISLGLIVVAPIVMITLFGEEFLLGILTIRIFSVLIIVKSFGNLLCYQLVIATGNEKKRLPAFAIAAVLNIFLNAVLIPQMAQNGAAIASVISEVVVNGVQFVALSKIINIKIPWKSIYDGIITSLLMCVIVYVLMQLRMNYALQLLLCISVGGVFYCALNFVMKNEVIYMMLELLKGVRNKYGVDNCT